MSKKPGQSSRKKTSKFLQQCLAVILTVALMISTVPIFPGMDWEAAAADAFIGNTVQPIVVVSGQGIIGSAYSATNISNEKSYTIDELKAIANADANAAVNNRYLYSAYNTANSASMYLGEGVRLDTLLAKSGVTDFSTNIIALAAPDNYSAIYDPAKTTIGETDKANTTQNFGVTRYYYPNLLAGGAGDANNPVEVPTILAWAKGGSKGKTEIPTTLTDLVSKLESMTGQIALNDYNNPLFNSNVTKALVGAAITEAPITIHGIARTRSQVLMMGRADRSYTYDTTGGNKTDYVRGVPLTVLLDAYNENDTVSFMAADGYDMSGASITIAAAKASNYMLAYEKGTSVADLKGIYDTAKSDAAIHGYFTLYGDGVKPSKLINNITVTPSSGINYATSSYKHITNGGISGQNGPYDIDAITGATLTIEGPGVKSSVPLPIRELEGQNAGAYRGTYTDTRADIDKTLQYEGIKLSHIINNMTSGDNGIIKTSKAAKVLIKNRVRQTVAAFTLNEIADADTVGKPIIIAYGTGTTDDATKAPFVFDGASGWKDALDNDDGPIKLVYDKTAFTTDPNPNYTKFGNVAYIYIAEETSPGYKHATAPYNTAENSQYVLTVTGDKIGREVNYTVKDLEAMVQYDENGVPVNDGMGYRDEYNLANSSYWYVNEYEGVQLSKLLQKSGLAADAPSGADKNTLVSFSATDNYKDFDKFSIEQIFNPSMFGYYEKNPADLNDGKYAGNAEDLRGTGYPVLVAYGVNSYPYVIKNTLDGFMSGLSNDGGPLRVISGKTAYNHANGSKQAKLLDKIIVGTDNFYSTHKYNPNLSGVYQNIANNSTLNVKVISGAAADGTVLKEQTYKVGDLEELLYGGSLTTSQLKGAKIKGFYEAYKNGSFYSDLYEGLDLSYFLEQVVQLPGYKGTITFSDGINKLILGLEEVLAFSGYNGTTGLGGLAPVIAYAKNGTPMVNSKDAADGYENTVILAAGTAYEQTITVKNNGGPLAVMFPRATADAATASSLNALTSITINLSADNYAHTEAPYNSLSNNTVIVSGAGTRLTAAKTFTVSDIEGKQTLAVTGDYNIKKSTDSQSQLRYRGIPLYDFFSSTDIGLKPNADKVIVTCSDNSNYTFDLADVYKSNYINGQNAAINNLKMILAYGSAPVSNTDLEEGKPLVQVDTDDGYVEAYSNKGGPIRLVVGQTSADEVNSGKILKDVTAIEVTASELTSWNHSSSAIYQQYLNTNAFQFQVVDSNNNSLLDKTYTLAQLEAMTSLVERENITWVGTQEWEGINLWKFALQEASSISGVTDPTSVTVFAADGFSKELRSIFGLDGLQNGIKDGEARIPIIIGYAVNGYPLVPSNTSDGYTYSADNSYGPLRLMTHGNQGACLKNTAKLVVKVGASGTDPLPVTEKDFNIYGLASGTVAMDIKAIKNITAGAGGKVVTTYNWFGDHDGDSATDKQATSDMVKGAYLADLLASAGVSGNDVKVEIVTTDGYAPDHYKSLTLSDIQSKAYFVAFDQSTDNGVTWTGFSDADKQTTPAISTVRIYRNYDNGSSTWYNRVTNVKGVTVTGAESGEPVVFNVYPADGSADNLPLASLRSVWVDKVGGLWVSTYGGGVAYKAASANTFKIYNKISTPALVAAVVSAVAVDADGGVWMTQNASYTDPTGNQGIAYMKDGLIKYYTEADDPKTIPNNYVQEIQIDKDGNIWLGSFGGLTKYNPTTEKWTTWDQTYTDSQGDRLPAMSIDNLIFDGNGGIWMGFYPNGAGTEADPFVGGFAHMTAAGDITSYKFTADYDATLESSLLAQIWVRDIAVDKNGGAWVVASGSTSGLANVGGTVWYVNNQGTATKFTGDELLGTGSLTGDSEIRMVTVDPDGGLWFGTSADGVFYIAKPGTTAPFTVTAKYNGTSGSWKNSSTWNNIYSLDFVDSTLYVGSSGGLACRAFTFVNAGTPTPVIINSFTLSGLSSGEVDYYVGGANAHTIKGLANGAGKVETTYQYNGKTHYVKGAYLSTLLAAVGAGNNITVSIKTSDNYTDGTYEQIPYEQIVQQEYFVAYDRSAGDQTAALTAIADTDNDGTTTSFRICRNYDAGGKNQIGNYIKCVTGIVINTNSGGETAQAPAFTNLTVSTDKKTITLTFDKDLDLMDNATLKSAIGLKKKGESVFSNLADLDQAEISGSTIIITLNTALDGTGNEVKINATAIKSGTDVATADVVATVPQTEGCFIATAAFGSYLDPHVWALRQFRDNVLLKNSLGKWFVNTYYHYSPPIANVIATSPVLRLMVRLLLTPIIFMVEYPLAATIILAGVFICWLVMMRRRRRLDVSVTGF